MSVKKRKICAAPRCLLTQDTQRSYFRFPKEHDRWLQWVHASKRMDLIPKGPEYAYTNCRLCHLHFESKWYKQNKCKTYLHPDAVPTIFFKSDCEQQNSTTAGNEKENAVLQKVDGNTCAIVTAEVQQEDSFSNVGTSTLFLPIEVNEPEAPKPSTSTERPDAMKRKSFDTPKVTKLLLQNKRLKAKNKSLRETIRRLRLEKKQEDTTVAENECDQLKKIGSQVLPQNFYKILEAQIDAKLKSKRGRRYDTNFKRFALSLYFLSPRAYREIKNSIALPSVHCLQLFTKKKMGYCTWHKCQNF